MNSPVSTPTTDPNGARPVVDLVEEAFGIGVSINQLTSAASDPSTYAENIRLGFLPSNVLEAVLSELRDISKAKIKVRDPQTLKLSPRTIPLLRTETRGMHPRTTQIVVFPKSVRHQAEALFSRYRIATRYLPIVLPIPRERSNASALSAPFRDGRALDEFQQRRLLEVLQAGHSGIIDYPMGGGKGLLIAGIARAFPSLRPLVVMGSKATDTAQLATGLVAMLGERVALLGCAGGVTAKERRSLFAPLSEATIIVGTHNLVQKVNPCASDDEDTQSALLIAADCGETTPAASGTSDLSPERIISAPFIIADEVHELPTLHRLSRLRSMRPQLFIGLTGTWLMRSDKLDEVLGALIDPVGAQHTLTKVRYSDVVATGRVVPVTVSVYQFEQLDYPMMPVGRHDYAPTLVHRLIANNDGRNRFCAELLKHLICSRTAEQRTVLACVSTIEHARAIARQLCPMLGVPPTLRGLSSAGVMLHNAQLPNAERVANVDAIRNRQVRLVISTDTLSVGFDAKNISDVCDLTGMRDVVRSLQRSGRPARTDTDKIVGYVHIIADTHHPAFVRASSDKRRFLEQYFATAATFYGRRDLPWLAKPRAGLTPELIANELANTPPT